MATRRSAQKNSQKPTRPAPLDRYSDGFFAELAEEILSWYSQNERDLPWRRTPDPYAIMVSELMLQQTQAPRVIPKYEDFMHQFPTVQSLAAAPLGEILRSWSGLGYNRRAKYLKLAAESVMAEFDGKFPCTVAELLTLPGVGPYTAGAIAAFAYNEDGVILETNVKRVYQLIFSGDDQSEATMRAIGARLLPGGRARDWYHSLMDLGSLIRVERGASAQQAKLRELFPMLEEVELPKFAGERVARPRQSPFSGSKRFYRGKVIRLLSENHLSKRELLKSIDFPGRLALLQELQTEGLIAFDGATKRYQLP